MKTKTPKKTSKPKAQTISEFMKGKHTPGPWKADHWATGYSISAPDSHYTVCRLTGCNNAEANAKLIAASPELIEVVQRLYFFATHPPALENKDRFESLINDARAAIAKATT